MNRRNFLRTLFGGAAALALDPEKLLWVPGEKSFFIPSIVAPTGNQFVMTEMITAETLKILRNNLQFARIVNREYMDAVPYQLGATIHVRRPPRFDA